MGRLDSGKVCKYHRDYNQVPGVCPACLRERLEKLHDFSNSSLFIAASSTSSPPRQHSAAAAAGALAANFVSPRNQRRHQRNVSEVIGSVSFVGGGEFGGGSRLKKSGTTTVIASRIQGGGDVVDGEKKRGRFWSKLMRLNGKRTKEVLTH